MMARSGVDTYFGTYARFDTASKKDAATLLGADNLVGDGFTIVFVTEDGHAVAWIQNKFGRKIGYFDDIISRKLSILEARNWELRALLSFVAYTDTPEPGHYWGEFALLCNDPVVDNAFSSFAHTVARKLEEGVRPDVDLGVNGIDQVIESKGAWLPSRRVPMPQKRTGTVIMKSRRKISEKMIEQGRSKNKGCYILSWTFLIVLVLALAVVLKTCGIF